MIKGQKMPEEQKQRMSKTRKERIAKGTLNVWWKGKNHSSKTRSKISKNHHNVSGENNPMFGSERKGKENPNWRGGVSTLQNLIRTSDKYLDWRMAVLIRDRWCCQRCTSTGGILEVHHIVPMRFILNNPDLLWDINNGITLCLDCHKVVDEYRR